MTADNHNSDSITHGFRGQPSPSSPNRDTQLFHQALNGRDPRTMSLRQISEAIRAAQRLKAACAGCEATALELKPVPNTDLSMCAECRDQVMRAHGERQ